MPLCTPPVYLRAGAVVEGRKVGCLPSSPVERPVLLGQTKVADIRNRQQGGVLDIGLVVVSGRGDIVAPPTESDALSIVGEGKNESLDDTTGLLATSDVRGRMVTHAEMATPTSKPASMR